MSNGNFFFLLLMLDSPGYFLHFVQECVSSRGIYRACIIVQTTASTELSHRPRPTVCNLLICPRICFREST